MKSETNCPFCKTILVKDGNLFFCPETTCQWRYEEYVATNLWRRGKIVKNIKQIVSSKCVSTECFIIYFQETKPLKLLNCYDSASDCVYDLYNIPLTLSQIKNMSPNQLDEKIKIYLTFQ